MVCITFNYNKNLIYAIVYWVLEIITRILIFFKWDYFEIITNNEAVNEYIYLILLNISDLLAGFLVLYIHFSLKKKQENESTENQLIRSETGTEVELITEEVKYHNKVNKSKIKLIIICLLDYLNRSAFFIFYQSYKGSKHDDISHKAQKDIITYLDIIARYVFSIIFFKTKVFKHHKFAIFILLISFIILIPTDILEIHFSKIDAELTYIYIAIFSIRGILFPLEDVIVKKVFLEEYILPEHLMFLRGLGEFLIILIITPFLYFLLYNNVDLEFGKTVTIVLMIILYTISSFVKAYLLLKVIYFFSSQSVSFLIISESITGSIAEIINYWLSDNKDDKLSLLFIEITVILITTFGTLVYDEIIIIKKCGLDLNVAKEIITRAKIEVDNIGVCVEEEEHETDEEEKIKNNNEENDETIYE